jgi:hypothetical protein
MTTIREYLIIPAAAVPQIDFDTVCETSAETLRYSVDGTLTFVKWDGERPSWTVGIDGAQGPYTHAEILEILSGPAWTPDLPSPFTEE